MTDFTKLSLPLANVKRALLADTTDVQIQPEAVELAIEHALTMLRKLGKDAAAVAAADGRKRILPQHIKDAFAVEEATKRFEELESGKVAGVPWSEIKERREGKKSTGSAAEQALARANMRLIKLGQKPELLGSMKQAVKKE